MQIERSRVRRASGAKSVHDCTIKRAGPRPVLATPIAGTMAFNKNQHYVPKVHLRPFTLDGENMAISLINITRLAPIENAPVKNQCSRDYFYGKDPKLESAINFIENHYGEVVRMLERGYPSVDGRVTIVLARFIYLQYLRTEAASLAMSEMALALHDVPMSLSSPPTTRQCSPIGYISSGAPKRYAASGRRALARFSFFRSPPTSARSCSIAPSMLVITKAVGSSSIVQKISLHLTRTRSCNALRTFTFAIGQPGTNC